MDTRSTFTSLIQIFLISSLVTIHAGCSSSGSGGDGSAPEQESEQVKDQDQDDAQDTAQQVLFSASNFSVSENADSVELTVVRQGNNSEPASVEYRTLDASAKAGEDYVANSGLLEWAADEADSRTIKIELIQDTAVEPAESFEVELFNNTGADFGDAIIASITINDDDQAQVTCIELEGGRITEDTTLAHPCYNVRADLSVDSNATLTIQPGVSLIFDSGTELTIEDEGLLKAAGSELFPIVFTGAIETPGFWWGLSIESIAPSVLQHVQVLYGGNNDASYPGNLRLRGKGAAIIEDSQLQFSSTYALNLSRDAVLHSFEDNTLTQNQGAPVRVHVNDVYTLAGNSDFTGNTSLNGKEHDRDFISIFNSSPNDISTDQSWQHLGVPYRMPGNITNITAILNIEAGVELEFNASGRLNIDRVGTLKAVGTAEQPVLITGVDKTPGSWDGIQFTFSGGDNVIEHAIVEYGGDDGNTTANVGVFGQDGRLTIKDTTLRHSVAYGFDFTDGVDLVFERVTATGNRTPGSIYISNLDEIDTQSEFVGNTNDIVEVLTGNVSSHLTIHDLGVPFLIRGNLAVDTDWTIEAGSELRFTSGTHVNVSRDGSLAITGTEDQPAILTGVQAVPGYWRGIQYTFSGSQLNRIEHAVIEYAGGPGGNTDGLVGFFGQDTHGVIKNSVLRGSATHGIWLDEYTTGEFDESVVFENIANENIYRD